MKTKKYNILVNKLKPYWKQRQHIYEKFIKAESLIEENMSMEIGEDLEFFYVDGYCVGIGHKNHSRRNQTKNGFPLIHDSDLDIKNNKCKHSFIPHDNESPYGYEICRFCGKKINR